MQHFNYICIAMLTLPFNACCETQYRHFLKPIFGYITLDNYFKNVKIMFMYKRSVTYQSTFMRSYKSEFLNCE